MSDDADQDIPSRARITARSINTNPALVEVVRRARRILPGDSDFGDRLSTAGGSQPAVVGRTLNAMTGADTDEEAELLAEGSSTDEITGLEVLRSGAGDGCGDTDDASNHEGEGGVVWSGPTGEKEDGASGHERGDAHSTDGV